jgi:hypothetical protein
VSWQILTSPMISPWLLPLLLYEGGIVTKVRVGLGVHGRLGLESHFTGQGT